MTATENINPNLSQYHEPVPVARGHPAPTVLKISEKNDEGKVVCMQST